MTTTAIRKKLMDYLKEADDKKVIAIYTMVEDEIEQRQLEYSGAFKAELDRRVTYYQSGSKMVNPVEMRNKIKAIQNKARR